MPSMSHEGPLDLVRDHPEIAVELVRGTVGVELPGQLAVSLAPTDMSAVVPVQYLADMVVLISDARDRVTSSTDPAQLDVWFDRAVTARTAAEVFTD